MTQGNEVTPQLRMLFPPELLAQLPPVLLPAGFRVRPLRPGDEANYLALMASAGFVWEAADLRRNLTAALPEGVLVVEAADSGNLAATAMACEQPPCGCGPGGELGWVAAAPAFRGRGLGNAVCLAVLHYFRRAGYRTIYLQTDDFRKAAIKTYWKQGWRPVFHDSGMRERWAALYRELQLTTQEELKL